MASTTKPLQQPHQAPPLWTGTPVSIVSDANRIIQQSRNNLDHIVQTVQPESATYANVLEPLAQDENAMNSKSGVFQFYRDVSPSPEVRVASGDATKLIRDCRVESRMREDLFHLVDGVKNGNGDLDQEERFFLKHQQRAYARNGLHLSPGLQRDCFEDIRQRLNELSVEFRRNVREAQDMIWLSPQELEGLPEDNISKFQKGTEENEGKFGVSADEASLGLIYRFCTKHSIRKRVFLACENRAADDVPIFKETMVLRDGAARMLGYPDQATFRLEAKIAKKPETDDRFLNDLKSRLVETRQRELEAMKALKSAEYESKRYEFDGKVYL